MPRNPPFGGLSGSMPTRITRIQHAQLWAYRDSFSDPKPSLQRTIEMSLEKFFGTLPPQLQEQMEEAAKIVRRSDCTGQYAGNAARGNLAAAARISSPVRLLSSSAGNAAQREGESDAT